MRKDIGYSLRPLREKLGVKSGMQIYTYNSPKPYHLLIATAPRYVQTISNPTFPLDFIHIFVQVKQELESLFPKLKAALSFSGSLWVSWPKSSSLLPTDLNENIIRDIGLAEGLVDVKVIAVDKDWSGLKFVYRLKDRKK
ncbi:MAG: DUF3052 domain-containing protein [Candidatus Levybacteria bacterium]|nr:DUF3052 domain-containing protein [Candidatus Levybacteria bacterium]